MTKMRIMILFKNEVGYVDLTTVLTSNPPKYNVYNTDHKHIGYIDCSGVHQAGLDLHNKWMKEIGAFDE